MKNYKHELMKLSKNELIKYIEISPSMVEKFEAENAGATHITEVNGSDAELPCGRSVEIKTQCYIGNYQLRGRGKYGSATMDIYKRKLDKNEHTIVAGYEPSSGEIFYRFSFDFSAIAPRYFECVQDRISRGLGPTNYDTYPTHYINHDSFKIEYVAEPVLLHFNKTKFTNKFYNFLLYNSITNKVDPDYDTNGKSNACYTAKLWDRGADFLYFQNKDLPIKDFINELQKHFNKCKEEYNGRSSR
jgi:hypothetical protein